MYFVVNKFDWAYAMVVRDSRTSCTTTNETHKKRLLLYESNDIKSGVIFRIPTFFFWADPTGHVCASIFVFVQFDSKHFSPQKLYALRAYANRELALTFELNNIILNAKFLSSNFFSVLSANERLVWCCCCFPYFLKQRFNDSITNLKHRKFVVGKLSKSAKCFWNHLE